MKRYDGRVAFAALLAALVLAVAVWTAPAASAAAAVPAARVPSCLPGHPRVLDLNRRVEGLIGNLSPATGSTVAAGSTISFLIADEVPFPTPLSCDVLVTVNGASVTPTAGAEESGVPITYANPRDMGSRSTNREVPYSLPSKISGRAHVRVTAYDGDGNKETISWTLTVQTTTVPTGAVGGIGLAVIGALVLMVVQIRRRRDATPTHD